MSTNGVISPMKPMPATTNAPMARTRVENELHSGHLVEWCGGPAGGSDRATTRCLRRVLTAPPLVKRVREHYPSRMNALATQLPEQFYLAMAIGTQSFDELCLAFELDPDHVRALDGDPMFAARLAQARNAVDDDGRAFRARCRTVVQKAIPRLSAIIHDPEVPASTQVDAFKALVKFGGLEPKETASSGTGTVLNFTIIAPDGSRMETPLGRVIDVDEQDEH